MLFLLCFILNVILFYNKIYNQLYFFKNNNYYNVRQISLYCIDR